MRPLLSSLLILFCIFIGGCSKKKESPTLLPPSSVKMVRAASKDVPLYISTVGHIEPYEIVNIMAQVDGVLDATYFEDGADVRQGDLLYKIDQRSYTANLERSEGALAQNLAQLDYATRKAERYSQLVKEEYISQDDYDNLLTTVLVNDANVQQSRAEVENAKINLGYTTIYAPLDARAGQTQVNNGNLILESSKTTLVTLNQITPIYATFFINEKDLPKVQRCQPSQLKTYISVEDPSTPPYEGDLTFIDNKVDLSTGMIKLKATLPNTDKTLWPHQYVKIKLILETLENAVLVPFEAVQNSANGKYVYVIKGNKTVEIRPVTIGQVQENNTLVITKGLKAGEKVVTEGQVSLYPGAKVRISLSEDQE